MSFRKSRIVAGAALILQLLSSCASAPAPGVRRDRDAVAIDATATVPVRATPPIPSRRRQTDAQGFYHQPAGLADDFPEEATDLERIRRTLAVAREAGAKYFRVGIGWDSIEESPGRYNWRFWDELVRLAPEHGITLLPYICYTPRWLSSDPVDYWRRPPSDLAAFGRFVHAIVSRYRGKVRSWELWNEPDIPNYWLGDAAQFAAMVAEGARQARLADPDATVVLGGMARGRSPFLEVLLGKHGIGRLFDVINLHGYLETWDAERAEEYPERLQRAADLVEAYAPGRELWLAEFGYSDHRESATKVSEWADAVYAHEHTPAYQAVALWKHHVLALASKDVALTTWYRIHDLPRETGVIGDDNNKRLGILDVQGRPKPAFHAMRLFNRVFDQPVRPSPGARIELPRRSQAVAHVFERKDGDLVVTAWLRSSRPGEARDRTGKAKDKRSERITIRLPISGASRWRELAPTGEVIRTGARLEGGDLVDVPLSGDQAYIAVVSPEVLAPLR